MSESRSLPKAIGELKLLCEVCKGLGDLKAELGRLPKSVLRDSLMGLIDETIQTPILSLLELTLDRQATTSLHALVTVIKRFPPETVGYAEAGLACTYRNLAEDLETSGGSESKEELALRYSAAGKMPPDELLDYSVF